MSLEYIQIKLSLGLISERMVSTKISLVKMTWLERTRKLQLAFIC